VILETERLLLRRPAAEDAPAFTEIWSDPEVVRFLGGEIWDLERAELAIERMLRHWEWFDLGLFTVVRKHDERILGRVGFLLWDENWQNGHLDRIEPVETEIGWTIGREFWNQGYATEAAAACRDQALGPLGLHRVISLIAPENHASIRVAEKIGETYEHEIRGGFFRFPVGVYALAAGRPAR
jgi:RimJ/RimL family protein N-acetyltransferase